jgi:hypothetical protein
MLSAASTNDPTLGEMEPKEPKEPWWEWALIVAYLVLVIVVASTITLWIKYGW